MSIVTRPLRAAARRRRTLRSRARPAAARARYDSWLTAVDGERLARIDAACADGAPERYALFRELDADLWALLLMQEYDVYPNIRALLPSVPDPALQQLWNGTSGAPLAAQSAAFYRRLCERFERHGEVPMHDARVLDFGCGWGRITRMLARDVAPERLYGCDPAQDIVDACRASGVPARLARSDFVPERLPFDGPFDLAFAFSVFTHLSEQAHERSLRTLHAALRPRAVLVVTIRPPEYLRHSELMAPVRRRIAPGEASYLFVPHAAEPSHPQYEGGVMTYGETVITLPYIRRHWAQWFELLDADILLSDLFQVVLTLRRS